MLLFFVNKVLPKKDSSDICKAFWDMGVREAYLRRTLTNRLKKVARI